LIDATGKARSSRRWIIRSPTAPLAPTTATFSRSNSPGFTKHDHPARAGWVLFGSTPTPRFRGKMLAEYVTISYDPKVREATRSGLAAPLAAVRSHESILE